MKKLAIIALASLAFTSPFALADDPVASDPKPAEARTFELRKDDRAGTRVMSFRSGGSRKMEKGSFLGLSTSTVPPALRAQLTLGKGMGLVIESIEKDSPAEKAGLQKYDVLQKLNDQLLINPQQFQVLVRSFQVGEEVTLSALRKGQPVTLKATLIEKDMPELGAVINDFNIEALPLPREIPNGLVEWNGQGNPFDRVTFRGNSNASAVLKVENQTIELTSRDGARHLRVLDQDGKPIFDGPIDTEEQRKALPEGVSEKLQRLEGKFQFRAAEVAPKP